MTYSKDLRKRIVAAVEKREMSKTEIQAFFQISKTGLSYLLQHIEETGSIEPKPYRGGRRSKFQEEDIEEIRKYLYNNPDATLEEILEYTGKDASIMSVFRTLKKMGYRLKKSHYSQANKKERMLNSKEKNGKSK